MKIDVSVFKYDEQASFGLRELYQRYGYSQYKMNKFEEYELYVRNKDFLVSDNVITFTDTTGKLMALKPDVTLSIIKNSRPEQGSVRKVYYDENVYRVSKGTHTFREITQVGLECIGDVDRYCIYEVLELAAASLSYISRERGFVLDISHMDIVSGLVEALRLNDEDRKQVLKCVGEKNAHGIGSICRGADADADMTALLQKLVMTSGPAEQVLSELDPLLGSRFPQELAQLSSLTSALARHGFGESIHVDFSVINDMNYYNGIVFKGFLPDLPTGILSGGQYDRLMGKMGSPAGAIGFAVYLDMLERLDARTEAYDVDALLLYGAEDAPEDVSAALERLRQGGARAMAQRSVPKKLRYGALYRLNGKEAEELERHA